MMKRWIRLLLLIAILLLGSLIVLITYNQYYNHYKAEQERLAEAFGVQIYDYPYPDVFPQGYFQSILTRDSTLEEVHNVVIGYEKVYKCGKNIEIYYYFSDSDRKALRFKISYSNDLKYEVLQGEDENSRYLDPIGCIEGRIGEK